MLGGKEHTHSSPLAYDGLTPTLKLFSSYSAALKPQISSKFSTPFMLVDSDPIKRDTHQSL